MSRGLGDVYKRQHFTGGKFVTPEEIEMNSAQYSSFLKEEIDHLNIVTQMWEEFK